MPQIKDAKMKKAVEDAPKSLPMQATTTPVKMVQKSDPKAILYTKIETIIEQMKQDSDGILFKTKNADVFRGKDLVIWLKQNLEIEEEREAVHLGSAIAAHGYLFQVDNNYKNSFKNDSSLHRFQNPNYWPSKCEKAVKDSDYALHLYKREYQGRARLELFVYEEERLDELKETLKNSWEDIEKRAEKEVTNLKRTKDKKARKIAESEEQAFWNLHRPRPGAVNVAEVDIKKKQHNDQQQRKKAVDSPSLPDSNLNNNTEQTLTAEIKTIQEQLMKSNLSRHHKTLESLRSYVTQHADPILNNNPHPVWDKKAASNKTLTDNGDLDYTLKGELSFGELLKDSRARSDFRKFLQKEYSAENLDFWLDCKKLKSDPQHTVKKTTDEIFEKYMHEGMENSINIDFEVRESVVEKMKNPKLYRYCFEDAQQQIYNLMKTDSYPRFLKSKRDNNLNLKVPRMERSTSSNSAVSLQVCNLQVGDKTRFGGSARQLEVGPKSAKMNPRRNSADC